MCGCVDVWMDGKKRRSLKKGGEKRREEGKGERDIEGVGRKNK